MRKLFGKWDMTAQQLADELEKGINDAYEWDDLTTTSVRDRDLDRLLDRLNAEGQASRAP